MELAGNKQSKFKGKPKEKKSFKFGNYSGYYHKRNGLQEDLRIDMLKDHRELFENKKILDIGCNSGFITVNIAKFYHPKSILGIDIDKDLIAAARNFLISERQSPVNNNNEEPVTKDFLNNVIFRQADYILKDRSLLEFEKPQYDTILCLSLTKWIHLNHGDAGIKFMFQRIFKQLNPNGHLILEAQTFDTYRKRSRLTPEINENYKSIRLRPCHFKSYLMSDEVGFADYFEIGLTNHTCKGFNRLLQVFVKK